MDAEGRLKLHTQHPPEGVRHHLEARAVPGGALPHGGAYAIRVHHVEPGHGINSHVAI